MLAADADMQVGIGRAAVRYGHPHERADALAVDRLERRAGNDVLVDIAHDDRSLDVVAREPEGGLGEVVGTEREEVGVLGEGAGHDARARQFDHRADGVIGALAHALLLRDPHDQFAYQRELAVVVDQRDHHLGVRRAAGAFAHRARRAHDRRDLHLVDLRVQDPEAAAAGAEHRIGLGELLHALERALKLGDRLRIVLARLAQLVEQVDLAWKELVQRRVEQADRDRQTLHRLE